MAIPNCLRLFVHFVRRADSRAACTAGKSSATSTPIIAITTSNSTNVKAERVKPSRFRLSAIAIDGHLSKIDLNRRKQREQRQTQTEASKGSKDKHTI